MLQFPAFHNTEVPHYLTQADSELCPDPAQLDYSPLTPTAFLRLVKCQKEEWHLPSDCSQNTQEPPGAPTLVRAQP